MSDPEKFLQASTQRNVMQAQPVQPYQSSRGRSRASIEGILRDWFSQSHFRIDA
jgi:hypothetical protein